MSDYSKVNLKEVEDAAPKFGFGDALSARFAGRALGAERIGLALERLQPNKRAPFGHRHTRHEEVYVVVSGSGRLKVEDELFEVAQWDAIRVAPQAARQFEAGPDGIEVLAFGEAGGADASTQDAEMLTDWWTD
jgi:mannose-6-phosphate isomerase-like protein (cupin superfamily)